jgi:hypothetical protein
VRRTVVSVTIVDAYLTETVTVTAHGALNAAGHFPYSATPASSKARVQRKWGVNRDSTGKEYQYLFMLFLPTTTTVAVEDRVTIAGVYYYVKDLGVHKDVAGLHQYTAAYVG